jgi:valyl-tRNA synthetase
METGYDILFFWVARMILMTTFMIREVPFKTVYLHGLVRTRDGKKMSKSDPLTCIDPLESIRDYGTDALRLALIQGTGPGQDLRLYPEKLESCRRFANKVWNAGRYILMNIPSGTSLDPPQNVQNEAARWLLHELDLLIGKTLQGLEAFRLSEVIDNLRSFFWGTFCDWYLEMDKRPDRNEEDNRVLAYALSTQLKLLHPYIPFVTEALWENLGQDKMLAKAPWPESQGYDFGESHQKIQLVCESVSQLRTLREKARLGLNQKVDAGINSEPHAEVFEIHSGLIKRLARISELKIRKVPATPSGEALSSYFQDSLVSINANALDFSQEISNLQKQLNQENQFLTKSRNKLKNPGFLNNAPDQVVLELREKVESTEKTIDALKKQVIELEQLAN